MGVLMKRKAIIGILILVMVGCSSSNVSLAPIYRCESELCYQDSDGQIKANELSNNPDLVDWVSPAYNFEKFTEAMELRCSQVCKEQGYKIYATAKAETVLNRVTGRKNYALHCLCADERKEI